MNVDEFWNIVDGSRADSQEEQIEKLYNQLAQLAKTEVIDFFRHYYQFLQQAYTWKLWGAAHVINGGCSDDWFAYFRDWLIAQGRAVYEKALIDPESLSEVATPEEADFEDFRYVMHEVFQDRFEQDIEEVPELVELSESKDIPDGTAWEEDELDTLFPKLTAWVQSFAE